MQKSNGHSCLHDLWSGTHVVALPVAGRAGASSRFATARSRHPARRTDRPVQVLGEAWRQGDECVMRAIDPSLDRPVWLWLRPAISRDHGLETRVAPRGRPRWLPTANTRDSAGTPSSSQRCPNRRSRRAARQEDVEQSRTILLDLSAELGRDPNRTYGLSQTGCHPRPGDVDRRAARRGGRANHADLLALVSVVLLEGKPPEPKRKKPPRAVLALPRASGIVDLPPSAARSTWAAFPRTAPRRRRRSRRSSAATESVTPGHAVMARSAAAFRGVSADPDDPPIVTMGLEMDVAKSRQTPRITTAMRRAGRPGSGTHAGPASASDARWCCTTTRRPRTDTARVGDRAA